VQETKSLPEREVSSLTLSSPNGPQARQKNDEWISAGRCWQVKWNMRYYRSTDHHLLWQV